MALICFATCYFLADIKKITWWTKPFVIFGTNALTAYFCSTLLSHTLDIIKLHHEDGTLISIKTFLTNGLASWAGHHNGMLFFAILYVLFWFAILSILYKNKIFIKL